ncbi:MAG: hypothetical protein RL481_392 [Pseudomonadota bacterium]
MRPSFRNSSLAVLTIALLVTPGTAQKTTGPKATYEMDVSTNSGLGMGMMMGGGLGGLGGILGGGGGDANYTLEMRLKSTTPSPKQPETGDHFFLPAAKLGKSVPLLGGVPGNTRDVDREPPTMNCVRASQRAGC